VGGRLEGEAQDLGRPTGPQRIGVIDAVATRKGRHDEAQELVPCVRPTGRSAEIDGALDEVPKAELRSQGGRQGEPRVRDQAIVIEGHIESVEAVRRSHLSGAPLFGSMGCSKRHRP
jgi:hypothetical protein